MNKNTLLVLGIVIVILIVAVGVAFMYRGKPETTTTTVSPTTAPQTPTFKGEVKIGILLPLNLPVAQQMLESYKMAIEDINAKGGVLGYKVVPIVYDTQWQADKAAEGYKYLASQNVTAVFGLYGSHEALAIMDLLATYRIPVIASGAVSDQIDLTFSKDYNSYKYWFRAFINSTCQARVHTQIVYDIGKALGYNKVAIIYEDLPWFAPQLEYHKKAFPELGMQLVAAIGVKTDVSSFADAFQKVMDAGAQLIVFRFSGTEDYVFARDYYDMQIPILAPGGSVNAMLDQFYNQTGGKAEGLITVSWGFPTNITRYTMDFYYKFKQRVGVEPFFTAWYAYDAIPLWTKAVEKAGTFDGDAVVAALEKIQYEGVAGVYEFNALHTVECVPDRIYPVFFQWQSGQRVVIWPLNVVAPGTKLLVPKLEGGKRVWVEVSWPPK